VLICPCLDYTFYWEGFPAHSSYGGSRLAATDQDGKRVYGIDESPDHNHCQYTAGVVPDEYRRHRRTPIQFVKNVNTTRCDVSRAESLCILFEKHTRVDRPRGHEAYAHKKASRCEPACLAVNGSTALVPHRWEFGNKASLVWMGTSRKERKATQSGRECAECRAVLSLRVTDTRTA
jgi:hypothetical protein